MVGQYHHSRLSILASELQSGTTRTVEGQEIGSHTYGIIAVSGPIHLATLYHQEETIRIFGEFLNGFAGHLLDRGLLRWVTINVIIHLSVAIECPHLIAFVGTHPVQVVAIDMVAIRFQVGFVCLAQQACATTDHDIQIVVCHLRGDPLILATVVAVCGAVGRCGVWKLAGEYQASGLSLQLLTSLQDGGQWLEGTSRIGWVNIVVGILLRVGRYVTCAAGLASHIARGRRSGVANRRIRGMRTHGTAQIGVDIQFGFRWILIPLQPASNRNGRQRCAIRNHNDHILYRFHVLLLNGLHRHHSGCQQKKGYNLLFHVYMCIS